MSLPSSFFFITLCVGYDGVVTGGFGDLGEEELVSIYFSLNVIYLCGLQSPPCRVTLSLASPVKRWPSGLLSVWVLEGKVGLKCAEPETRLWKGLSGIRLESEVSVSIDA